MGFFFSPPSVNQSAPVIASMRVQTSAYGGAIPIVFGMTRVPANLIQYEDFTAIKHSESAGGKGGGGGGSITTYTYTAMVLLRLAHGVLAAVPRVWKDKSLTTPAGMGFTFFDGSAAQNPFGALLTGHPDRALAYRGLAYMAHEALDLGSSATIGNLNFEVKGLKPFGGVGRVIEEVRLRQGAQPWNRISSALVQSSPDKAAWNTIATIAPVNDAALHAYAVPPSTSRPYWRLLANSSTIGWRGAWDGGTNYSVNDIVISGGSLWIAYAPVLGTPPAHSVDLPDVGWTEVSGWNPIDAQAARWEVVALEFATAAGGADISTPQQAASGGDWNS